MYREVGNQADRQKTKFACLFKCTFHSLIFHHDLNLSLKIKIQTRQWVNCNQPPSDPWPHCENTVSMTLTLSSFLVTMWWIMLNSTHTYLHQKQVSWVMLQAEQQSLSPKRQSHQEQLHRPCLRLTSCWSKYYVRICNTVKVLKLGS